MKVGCCSSRCLALLLLALLEAVTLVFPQQQQRCEDLTNTCSMLAITNLSVVTTGMEISRQMCSIIVPIETGDAIDWYFTRTTIESATRIVIDGSKYRVDGELSQILIVNNVSLSDEGYYFCQLRRNGQLTPQQGSCLRVLAPAMFQTCEGDNIPQRGCSDTELLTATIGESVDFNIVLVHGSKNESCNNQFINMISFFKISVPSSMMTLTNCSNSNCAPNNSLSGRLNVSRTQNEFDINVTLNNLTAADSGSYSAVADIRRPPNSMRVCMYKNFTLTVSEKPISGQETTIISTSAHTEPISDQEIIIFLTLVLLFIIVAIIILIVCICSICCYHYKKKTRLGQRLRRISKGGPASNIYDVPTEIYDAQLIPDDREVTIAHPINQETRMSMQENSAYGTNIAIAPEIANIAYGSDSGEKEIGHAVNEYGLESKTDDSTCPTTCQGPQ